MYSTMLAFQHLINKDYYFYEKHVDTALVEQELLILSESLSYFYTWVVLLNLWFAV